MAEMVAGLTFYDRLEVADSGHALSAPKGAGTLLGFLSCSLSAQSRLRLGHAVSLCEALTTNSDKAWIL